MKTRKMQSICIVSATGRNLFKKAMTKFPSNPRAYDRILKVIRIITNLAGSEDIETDHLVEAAQFGSLDRGGLDDITHVNLSVLRGELKCKIIALHN